jgi:hypothetical protein
MIHTKREADSALFAVNARRSQLSSLPIVQFDPGAEGCAFVRADGRTARKVKSRPRGFMRRGAKILRPGRAALVHQPPSFPPFEGGGARSGLRRLITANVTHCLLRRHGARRPNSTEEPDRACPASSYPHAHERSHVNEQEPARYAPLRLWQPTRLPRSQRRRRTTPRP